MNPIIVPTTTPQTTARSRELEARLRAAIADYTKANPKMTRAEIASAVQAIRVFDDDEKQQKRKVAALSMVAAGFVAILLGGLANARDTGRPMFMPLIGLAVFGVLLGAVAFLKWRDR